MNRQNMRMTIYFETILCFRSRAGRVYTPPKGGITATGGKGAFRKEQIFITK